MPHPRKCDVRGADPVALFRGIGEGLLALLRGSLRIDVELDRDRRVRKLYRGDVHEVRLGDSASSERYALRSTTQDTDRIKPVESVAGASFSTFQILKATVANLRVADRPFEWNYTLEAPNYAKTAGELLLVRPRVLGSKSSGLLETKEARQYPVEFEGPERDTDVFEIELPAAYQLDDLPPPINLDDGFASYQSKTEIVGRTLRYTRTFEIKDLSVPLSEVEKLRQFYRVIADDERNSAVLKRVSQSLSTPTRLP